MTERAEVLVVGAGASGGVVARRLARAGFEVVCLEQGGWHDRAEFPARRPEFELLMRKQWTWSPNDRGRPEDYPVNVEDSDIVPVMFNGVGGSMILYGGDWARLHPSDFRVRDAGRRRRRLADQLRGAPAVLRADRRRVRRVGPRRQPRLSAGGRAAPAATADRPGRAPGRSGARAARLALVAGYQLGAVGAVRRAAAVHAVERLLLGLPSGREGHH